MNHTKEEIIITYSPRIVRISCNSALKNYLEEPGNGALVLSSFILEEYKKRQQSELKTSKDSLAIEISGPYLCRYLFRGGVCNREPPSACAGKSRA